jgi:ATP-dependent DNA ligase
MRHNGRRVRLTAFCGQARWRRCSASRAPGYTRPPHPAASRVTRLAGETPASFIAFDLLALDDDDLTGEPFAGRRAALERALAQAGPHVHVTPITRDEQMARDWFERFEGAGLDGLIAKRADLSYQPDKRVMAKIKHVRTADCVVAGYRVHKSAPDAIGSLLLGLYIDDATPRSQWRDHTTGLAPVGIIGAFPMARRRELLAELQPLMIDFAEHPWSWAAEMTQGPEAGSRWNPKKDLSFVPLRPGKLRGTVRKLRRPVAGACPMPMQPLQPA